MIKTGFMGMDELEALRWMVQQAAIAMNTKLQERYEQGYTGWDTTDVKRIEARLLDAIDRAKKSKFTAEHLVDLLNLSAILYNRRV